MDELRDDIEKYLRGEMSPAEMHALEKKALSDPFLADALEGAGSIDAGLLSADLDDLRRRSCERASARTRPLWYWPARIAAGIAIVGLVSYFVIIQSNKKAPTHIAQNRVAPEKSRESVPPPAVQQADSVSPEAGAASATKPAPRMPVTRQPERSETSAEVEREPLAAGEDAVPQERDSSIGIAMHDSQPKEVVREAPAAQGGALAEYDDEMAKLEQSIHPRQQRVITGTVVDAEDGRALPGVNVMIKGTPIGTTTNEEGKYVIATDSLDAGLQFSFIGYEDKVVRGQAGNVDVMLDPDIAELSEVVVVGYGGTKREDPDADPIIEIAEPAGGRKAYKQYLTENLRYPEQALNNKIEGRVTVQFTIDPAGKMSDFKVLRGLGYGCDEEVIRLIRQGPKWKPSRRNTEPVADKVKVRMKFSLPKK